MSHFHEDIREVLNDVHKYLITTLPTESISVSALNESEKLVQKINCLHHRYPQLQLNLVKFPSTAEAPPTVESNNKNTFASYIDKRGLAELTGVKLPDGHEFEKYGFLEKKGKEHLKGLISMSQKKWYGIKNGLLYYYDKSTSESQKGTIPLAGYEVEVVKDRKNCFQITCPGKRTYQFIASSVEDLEQWIAAINRNNNGNENNTNLSKSQSSSLEEQGEDFYEIVDEEQDLNEDKKSLKNAQKRDGTVFPPNTNMSNGVGNDSYTWNFSQFYVGLWDCKANDCSELNFSRGDVIRIVSKEHDAYAWWIGELDGKIGFVPKSYLMEAYEV